MPTIDVYNSEQAVSMRKELNSLGEKMSDLQYQLFVVNKELKEKQELYLEFLGVIDEKMKAQEKGKEENGS